LQVRKPHGWHIVGGSANGLCTVDCHINGEQDLINGVLQLPVAMTIPYVPSLKGAVTDGSVRVQIQAKASAPLASAVVQLEVRDAQFQGVLIPRIHAEVRRAKVHRGMVDSNLYELSYVIQSLYGEYEGSIRTTEDGLVGKITNCTDIAIPGGMRIPARAAAVSVTSALTGEWHGSLATAVIDRAGMSYAVQGSLRGSKTDALCEGRCGAYDYAVVGKYKDTVPQVTSLTLKKKGSTVVAFDEQANGSLQGCVDYGFLADIARMFGTVVSGEGTVLVEGRLGLDCIDVRLKLEDASVRVPYIYNVIEQASASLQFFLKKRLLRMEDVRIKLHKGVLDSSRIVVQLDTDNHISFLYAPIRWHDCFMSWDKNLFVCCSGAGFVGYTPTEGALVSGFVMIDRSHIGSNIFASEFQRQLTAVSSRPFTDSPKVRLQVHGTTRRPLQVKTSFLEASGHADLHVEGPSSNLMVHGKIDEVQGSFLFPYKPLFIRNATLEMLPHQGAGDSTVEVVAENAIKGYHIEMRISGSANAPKISFSSTPQLSEEQIIGLLWGGSEEGSLYVAMSASIMQSLEKLIVGPSENSSHLMTSLKNFFKPLGSVRFVPSFTDQSARGGLRGSLAVEVNDRLRGTIKQNFDLPQDVMLEVEYALSDDARIRGFKDERGDLGAEFETSWKF